MAKYLRHTDKRSNVYISPDLAPTERENAGEMNIFIRGSQIITKVSHITRPTHEAKLTSNQVENSNTGARQDTKWVTGATHILRTPTSQQ